MKNIAHAFGLVLGATLGLYHAAWSLLVAIGLAQPLLNWVLQLHMLQVPMTVQPFSFSSALVLVIFTTLTGYVIGYIVGSFWTYVAKK